MEDLVGQQFGNYRLVRYLGSGTYADVYQGENIHVKNQRVAVKVLGAATSQQAVEAFKAEAQIIAQFKHPNIVRLYDFGVFVLTQQRPYLVMEYASRGSLRTLYPRDQPVSLGIVRAYVAQIADALQYAHDRHIIHQDIKPANMLLGEHGEVLLSDFGLATAYYSSLPLQNQPGAGTPAYMAPEQFLGSPCPASDQYAMGVVIYEWLTGERPLRGLLQGAPPSSLRAINPAVPPAVEEVVQMALAHDPAERFASMSAFATAFATACQTAPEQLSLGTRPMGASAPIPSWPHPADQAAPGAPPNPAPTPGYSTRPLPTAPSSGGLTTRPQPTEPATASGPVASGLPMQSAPAAPAPFGRPTSGPAPAPPGEPVAGNAPKRGRRVAVLGALVAVILLAALAGGVLLAQKLGGSPASTAHSRTTPQPSPTPTPTSIPGVPKGYKLYDNKDGTFSVIYPQAWKTIGSQSGGVGVEFDGPAGQMFTATNDGGSDLTPDTADSGFCLAFGGPINSTTVTIAHQRWTQKKCNNFFGKQAITEAVVYKGALYFMAYASGNDTFAANVQTYFTLMEQSFKFLSLAEANDPPS